MTSALYWRAAVGPHAAQGWTREKCASSHDRHSGSRVAARWQRRLISGVVHEVVEVEEGEDTRLRTYAHKFISMYLVHGEKQKLEIWSSPVRRLAVWMIARPDSAAVHRCNGHRGVFLR
jgi:hypothetical protein